MVGVRPEIGLANGRAKTLLSPRSHFRFRRVPYTGGFSISTNSFCCRFTVTGSASFTQAPLGTEGNASIYNNQFRNPWFRDERISVNKLIGIWGEGKVSLRYTLFIYNPFQRTDFGSITSTITSGNFGRPGGAMEGARQMSMGLRLYF